MKIRFPEIKKPDIRMPHLSSDITQSTLRRYWALELAAGVVISCLSILIAAFA